MSGSEDLPQSILSGRYELHHELGRGGMAVVYAARDLKHDRDVAVKMLPEALSSDVNRERFHREIGIPAGLNHPHIVPIFDSGEAGGLLYYVMPLVAGETLRRRLDRLGSLTAEATADIALDLCAALDHAHAQGVVHRDIKPGNVFLTGGEALLSDFGIALVRHEALEGDDPDRLTSTGVSVGTPRYMSPEQLTDPEAVGPSSDVFSLGVLLFECLTGELPFGRREPGRPRFAWMVNGPGSLGPDCPGPLADFVLACLNLDAEARPPGVGGLLEACQSMVAAVRSPPPAPTGGWWRGPWGIAGAGVVAVAGTLLVQSRQRPPTPMVTPRFEAVVTWSSREEGGRFTPSYDEVSFISDRGGVTNLWAVSLDGVRERRITNQDARITSHVWSPDGGGLAYTTISRDGRFLHLANADGAVASVVPLPPASEVAPPPILVAWLDGGIYVLFAGELWIHHPGADRLSQLTGAHSTPSLRWVDVRDDGKKMVFASDESPGSVLWVSNVDGSDMKRLTDNRFVRRSPCWLGPGGKEVAFLSDESGQRDVWKLRVSDGMAQPLTGGSGGIEDLTCARDGRGLVLHRQHQRADLWERGPNGRDYQLTSDSREDLMGTVVGDLLAFQRTRTRMASGHSLFDASIVLATLRGHTVEGSRVLVEDGFSPRLSPDGRWVAFLRYPSEAGGSYSILAVTDTAGTDWQVTDRYLIPPFRFLPPVAWSARHVAWSPSGPSLYFLAGSPSGRPVLMRADMAPGGPETRTVLDFAAGEEPMGLAPSPEGERLAYLVHVPVRGVRELRLWDPTGGRSRVLFTDSSAVELHTAGWISEEGPIVLIRSLQPTGDESGEPILVGLQGDLRHLPVLDHAIGAQAKVLPGTSRLLAPFVEGDVPSLAALDLDDEVARWTVFMEGFPYSALEALDGGRLLYARHELNADVWAVFLE